MAVIQCTCTRVVRIDQGRLVFDGPVAEGVRNYAADGLAPPVVQRYPSAAAGSCSRRGAAGHRQGGRQRRKHTRLV